MKKKRILIAFVILVVIAISIFGLNLRSLKEVTNSNIKAKNSVYSGMVLDTSNETDMVNGIFVSSSGTDMSGYGTETQPYKTISYALENAQPGQTIYLRAGTYTEQVSATVHGTEGNPITIRNYPGEEVTVSATGIENATAIFDLNNSSYINIVGLTISGITETENWAAYGILFRGGASHIIISDCEFTQINANGTNGNASPITLWGDSTTPITNVLIQNNNVHDCKLGWSEGIAVVGNIEYVDIIGNTVHDINNIGIDIQGNYGVCSDESLDHGRYVYIAQNKTYNCVSPIDSSAGIYVDGASNVIIERNISYNNTLGIEVGAENGANNDEYLPHNNLVINNLVYNNTEYGIELGGYTPDNNGKVFDTKVYFNTVINPSTSAGSALAIQKGEGYDIKNNIFADYGTWNYLITSLEFGEEDVKNVAIENNLLYSANYQWFENEQYIEIAGVAYTTETFNAATFTANNILEQEPNLTSDYRLQETSPAVDAGVVIAGYEDYLDLDGNLRTSVIDMGCYAYSLTPEVTVDKTKLKELIDSIANYESTDYSTDSWSNLQESLSNAENVYNSDTASQEEVNEAANNLSIAIDALTTDKTKLKATIDSIANYSSEDYTEESWTKLLEELDIAQGVYDNVNAKQSEIDTENTALQEAISNLIPVTKVGSLTIICHEQKNGDTTTNPTIEGIEYTIYKVDETCEDVWDAETYIKNNSVQGVSKSTQKDGTVIFDNLGLGRYYVKVTKVPDGAYNYSDFLVDIPMTNATGTGLDYDITVEPKIQTAYGNLKLTKVDSQGNPIENVSFKLQVMVETLQKSLEDNEKNVWYDYIPSGSSDALTFTTDINGEILLENIPVYNFNNSRVIYRLVEISSPDKYIINNSIIESLVFGVNEDGSVYVIPSYITDYVDNFITNIVEGDNLTTVTYINESPEIVKKVKNSADEFVDSAGLNMTDTVTFKLTTDVPMQISDMTTYKISDNIPSGLTLDRNSIVVQGVTATSTETISTDVYTLSDTGLELTFDTSKMYDTTVDAKTPLYESISITYNVTFDENNAVIGGNGNINTATLEYTNNIDENGNEVSTTTVSDTAEVHTGGLKIEKVEKEDTNAKLQGAKFKIATTKENAEAGIYVKDINGEDIEVTTDINGVAQIKGLAYADDGTDTSYWLVETQAPTYTEVINGQDVEKSYTLLKSPVEVKVGKLTYDTAIQVANSKGIDLPATGGIGMLIFVGAGICIMSFSIILRKKEEN